MCSDRLRPRSGASSSQQRVLALSRESTAPESSTHEPLLPWAPRSTSTGCVSMLRQTPRPRPCCNCMLLHARILVPIRRWSHLLIRPGSSPRSVRISDIKQHVMCSRECICLAKVLRNWRFSPCAAVQVLCGGADTTARNHVSGSRYTVPLRSGVPRAMRVLLKMGLAVRARLRCGQSATHLQTTVLRVIQRRDLSALAH